MKQSIVYITIVLVLSVLAQAHTGKHYPFMKDTDGVLVNSNNQLPDYSTRHMLSANSVLTTYLEFQHYYQYLTSYDYLHSGVDFAAPSGTIVWCCKSGVVSTVSDVINDYDDSMTVISDGKYWEYDHMSIDSTSPGEDEAVNGNDDGGVYVFPRDMGSVANNIGNPTHVHIGIANNDLSDDFRASIENPLKLMIDSIEPVYGKQDDQDPICKWPLVYKADWNINGQFSNLISMEYVGPEKYISTKDGPMPAFITHTPGYYDVAVYAKDSIPYQSSYSGGVVGIYKIYCRVMKYNPRTNTSTFFTSFEKVFGPGATIAGLGQSGWETEQMNTIYCNITSNNNLRYWATRSDGVNGIGFNDLKPNASLHVTTPGQYRIYTTVYDHDGNNAETMCILVYDDLPPHTK